MSRLVEVSPYEFVERMRSAGRRRLYLVYDPESRIFQASHPDAQQLADFLASEARDGPAHEAIFLEIGRETQALMGAFLHKTLRGQAQGGLRHWPYERLEDFLRDGLRLSRGMTRKNALAGLWWGGGKGLIARPPGDAWRDPDFRRSLYREYGAFVSSLRGSYVTAEDVGTSSLDIAEVYRTTRFLTCVPPECGGSGDPSRMTAAGVVCAMQAALHALDMDSLADKTIAIQGSGSVGSALISMLLDRGVARIAASEICEDRRAAVLDALGGRPVEIRLVQPGDEHILAEPCDILAPCALGGVLGPKTIPSVQARIICGAANNQLLDEARDAAALADRGITFVPDFLANRMGIVSCSNEQYGYVNNDPAIRRHLGRSWKGGIYLTTLQVLDIARTRGITPMATAIRLADELAEQPHPLWSHRGRQIIESLVADRWADH